MRDQRLIGFAKQMRRAPSPFEQKMWLALRAKRFAYAKVRRQVVIDRYIVDLACRLPIKLIVEIDGESHAMQAHYDAQRTQFLEHLGYRVLRFTNAQVAGNFEGVMMSIRNILPLSPLAARVALSPEGERKL